jgi:non-heme chloroperoxidase
MNRRNLLQSVASAVAGAGMMAVDPEAVCAGSDRPESRAPGIAPEIETRDGVRIFYRDWGTGKPVLFVHSWSANTQLWQYQMVNLCERGFRCVAYDKRGHGHTGDPGRGYDYDTLADDLAIVIEKLELRNTALVGHSMGCGEIVRYVSRHGAGRVSKVVLIGPTLPFILKTADNPDGIEEAQLEQLRAAWVKDLPKWIGDNARPFFVPETSQQMVDWAVGMSGQASLKALVDCNRAITRTDFREELRKFEVPTLVIQGDADVSANIDFTGRRTAALIPRCEMKVYEGAAHGLMLTHIERLNNDLANFLGA